MPSAFPAYIGIMSGTSLDGLDGVIAEFRSDKIQIHAFENIPYPQTMAQGFKALFVSSEDEIERLQLLAQQRAHLVAELVARLQTKAPEINIIAIGDHGQTVRHFPNAKVPYTLQVQNGALISELCGLETVVDFRNKDIANGGQGAPLTPAFHQAFFSSAKTPRAVINIGGIANLSLLAPKGQSVLLGFDTGPGNTLMDIWCQKNLDKAFDENGQWAQSGSVHLKLLHHFMDDGYFRLAAPKSTGREYFNQAWLDQKLSPTHFSKIASADVQASLTALTAQSIASAIPSAITSAAAHSKASHDALDMIYTCGGGVKNGYLMRLLQAATALPIQTTASLGLPPQQVEAAAFAWLAKQAVEQMPIDLRAVTGSKKANVLGVRYLA